MDDTGRAGARNVNTRLATGIGFTAVLMWALLALMSAASGNVPPFQLAAMTFLVGGTLGALSWPLRPGAIAGLRQDWRVWLLGIAGLFGYHFFYFSAIRAAPAIEVSLVAYLWPLFLVLFSSLLPGEKLKAHHVAGVVMGLFGAVLVITKGDITGFGLELKTGHVLAFACPVIWAGYSVLSRRYGKVPTDVVSGYCLASSVLSLICHLIFEETVWPVDYPQWASILGLGLLPVGAAFYAWDYGVKHGDIMVLGAAAYAAPVLSTLLLVASGFAEFHWSVIISCGLITAGALIAAKDMFAAPRKPAT